MDMKTIELMRDRVNRADKINAELNRLHRLKHDIEQPQLSVALPNCSGSYFRVDVPVTDDVRKLLLAWLDEQIEMRQKELTEI